MADRKTSQLVRTLRDMMSADRSEREQHYRAAAEKIVDLRAGYQNGSGPDWAGRTPDYKAAIQAAYREAGVPPDSADTVQASIRYHINAVLHDRLTADQLEAAGLDKASTRQKMRGEAPVRPRKARPPAIEYQPTPMVSRTLGDPVALVTQAVQALEIAAEQKPTGAAAATIRLLLRSVRDAADRLAAIVDQNENGRL